MIQTVIFDLDGVIIDSEPVHFRLEKQMLNELQITVSSEELANCGVIGRARLLCWNVF